MFSDQSLGQNLGMFKVLNYFQLFFWISHIFGFLNSFQILKVRTDPKHVKTKTILPNFSYFHTSPLKNNKLKLLKP